MDQEIKKEFEILTEVVRQGFDGVDSRLDKVEGRLSKVEDGLVGLEQKVDAGFAQFSTDLNEVKESLRRLERRTKEDADVTSEEVISLRRRVEILEKQFKQMQTV